MKRLLIALALLSALAPAPLAAQPEPWTLERFDARLEVGRDGHLRVIETLEAEFAEPQHGIYRYIPYQGTDDQGNAYELDVSLESVMRAGQKEPVQETRVNGNVVWRIGDAGRTLTGPYAYVLTYDVVGAVRGFEAFDELYWNVAGEGWDVPLPPITASLALPEGVSATQAACYTGPYGSTEQACTAEMNGGTVRFANDVAGQSLTIAVGFPKGEIAAAAATGRGPLPKSGYVLIFVWFVLLPISLPTIYGFVLYRRWRKIGKDRRFRAITPQYDPPDGLRPAETHALLLQRGERRDLPATIVDLAVRGYVRIEETTTGSLFKRKDHLLHLLKGYAQDPAVKLYERLLLDALFGGAAAPASVRISALANRKFRQAAERSLVELSDGLAAADYFDPASHKERMKLLKRGAILLLIDAVALGPILFLVSPLMPFCIAATALLMIFFGWFMVRWTPKGHAAASHAKGYELFIGAVEKYRAPWMETQDIFEKTLPYAMVFGLGARWAQAFASLHMRPPAWYVSPSFAHWSPVTFEKSLNSWASSLKMVARNPGARAGSGGRGFSGGGFGGGGGGSW